MQTRVSRPLHRFLDRPVTAPGGSCCSPASSRCSPAAALPLWRIQPRGAAVCRGLTLDMYAYQIVAGNNGQDLAEINTLNHYIGMKPIAQADFLEMKVLPFAIGVFALLALRAAVIGRIVNVVDLAVMFVYFGDVLARRASLSAVHLRTPSRSAGADEDRRRSCRS